MLDVAATALRVASLALASHRFGKLGQQICRLAIELIEGREDDLAMRDVLDVAEKAANPSFEGYWPRLVTGPNRQV